MVMQKIMQTHIKVYNSTIPSVYICCELQILQDYSPDLTPAEHLPQTNYPKTSSRTKPTDICQHDNWPLTFSSKQNVPRYLPKTDVRVIRVSHHLASHLQLSAPVVNNMLPLLLQLQLNNTSPAPSNTVTLDHQHRLKMWILKIW